MLLQVLLETSSYTQIHQEKHGNPLHEMTGLWDTNRQHFSSFSMLKCMTLQIYTVAGGVTVMSGISVC